MEKTISSKLHHKGKYFSFKTDTVQLKNGKQTNRDIVEHPGAVAIIPIKGEEIALIKQYRYAARKTLLEIPAGTLEIGEDPLNCAIRELREETGYGASDWNKLLSCYMAPGYSSEVIHFFVAEGLTLIGGTPEEDEDIDVVHIGFNEALEMIENNTIEDSKTITGILAYLTKV